VTLDLMAAFAAGYFLGGLPSAVWIARLAGRDIFRVGSGNMGSMNTARNVGPVAGVAVFVLDVGKGAAAVATGLWMGDVGGLADPLIPALAAAVGVVVGHGWSPYARFRGGKGLAAAFGATLPIVPLGGLAALTMLVALILITRRSEASALIALAALPFLAGTVVVRQGGALEDAFTMGTGMALVAAVSLVKHLQAYRRLARERRAGRDAADDAADDGSGEAGDA
jgi:glycerol-3-phosphate acyltransferase PlsY